MLRACLEFLPSWPGLATPSKARQEYVSILFLVLLNSQLNSMLSPLSFPLSDLIHQQFNSGDLRQSPPISMGCLLLLLVLCLTATTRTKLGQLQLSLWNNKPTTWITVFCFSSNLAHAGSQFGLFVLVSFAQQENQACL
jgi:hypothetical protein